VALGAAVAALFDVTAAATTAAASPSRHLVEIFAMAAALRE
jgi:hypothetical protein